MIYILGRMGHHKRALDLILTQMRDINQAIQFVQVRSASLLSSIGRRLFFTLWKLVMDAGK